MRTGRVAEICQVSPMTIAKWIDGGELRGHTTPGGHRRVAASDLVFFLQRAGMNVPEELHRRHRPRVLAVHRDPGYLKRLAEVMLDAHDLYEFRGTARGVDGLLVAGEWQPHVVLLDLMLPDVDGVQICQRFSELASARETRVIALAPESNAPLARAARSAGASACVPQAQLPGSIVDLLTQVLSLSSNSAR